MRGPAMLALAIVALVSCAVAPAPVGAEQMPRYAYIVGCDGIVDKVDTVGKAPLRTTNVGQQLPIDHNQFHSGTFDTCLTSHALYAPRESAFYALVPDRYSDPQRVAAFRFSIPELTWKKAFDAGDFDGDTALALPPGGNVRVAATGDRLPTFYDPVTSNTFTALADSPATAVSLIGRSDTSVLLWVSHRVGNDTFSVANTATKAVTPLDIPAGTDRDSVHLAPGGSCVYVEEARRVPGQNGEDGTWKKTGGAQLYDAATGKRIRDFADPRIATMALQAISPNGKAIYSKGRRYFLLNLGRMFSDREVITHPKEYSNSVFFADR